jgi:hypothetical protein
MGDAPLHGPADEHPHGLAVGMDLEMLPVADRDLGGPGLRILLQIGVDDVPALVGHGDLQEGAGRIGIEGGLHGMLKDVGLAIGKVGLQAAHGVVQAGQQGLHLHRNRMRHLPHAQPGLGFGEVSLRAMAVHQHRPVRHRGQQHAAQAYPDGHGGLGERFGVQQTERLCAHIEHHVESHRPRALRGGGPQQAAGEPSD